MRNIFLLSFLCCAEVLMAAERWSGKGLRLDRDGAIPVVFLTGSPEEIGRQHGELMKEEIISLNAFLQMASVQQMMTEKKNLFMGLDDLWKKAVPYIPERYVTEMDAKGDVAGISRENGHRIASFTEFFHCSGVAARGKATTNGQVVHVRVLDYMREYNLQKLAAIQIFMPDGMIPWISVGFGGLNGTITAMNANGLAIGEIGGRGEGNWDGIPMSFLMRRIAEECSTVAEALELLKKAKLTCEFFYVLSDKSGNMASVWAEYGKPPHIAMAGEKGDFLPEAFEDIAWYTRPSRMDALRARLHEYYGKIDVETMKQLIKPPVAMDSNLQDVVFLPQTLELHVTYAGVSTLACDEPYSHVDFGKLLEYYRNALKNRP